MPDLTQTRRALATAIEPLLRDGEAVTVTVGPSQHEGQLTKQDFAVTVTVGEGGDEALNERLDELLSGPVTEALQGSLARPKVTKTSGYLALQRPGAPTQLGATWTAQTID